MLAATFSFLAVGMVTASLGPGLPTLAERLGTEPSALGGLFTAFFLGALLSIAAAGHLIDQVGQVPIMLTGAALAGLGVTGLTLTASLPAMLGSALLIGLGQGSMDLSTNVFIARRFAERTVPVLNLLNVFFGVGAMAGPALAGFTMSRWSTGLSGLWLGVGLIILAAAVAALQPEPSTRSRATSLHQSVRPSVPYRSALLWTFGLLMLLNVGVQNGLGGWATTYLNETTTLDSALAALATSGFWMASTVGRMLGATLGTRLAPLRLLGLFLSGTVAGGILLVVGTGSAPLSVTAILLLGLAYGPVFPTMVGLATTSFPATPGFAGSFVMVMGTVGGMIIPWFQGLLMAGSGPRASVVMIAVGTVVMLGLQQIAKRQASSSAH